MKKSSFSAEVKWAVIKDKLEGELTNREIMDKYGIKTKSTIQRWMRLYNSGQMDEFERSIGRPRANSVVYQKSTEERK
ncbi:helix-turn-helix domain-containing protein [Bacillus sp. JJ722]